MQQLCANQHNGRVTVWESAHYTSTAADFPVYVPDYIVGTDEDPVFTGKITIGKCFLNVVLHFLG